MAGAIVPDLPAEESAALSEVCRRHDFSLVQLIAPTTPRERALRIAERTSGFIYYVSVTGITGERTELPPQIVDNVAWLRGQTPLPICIGFGISRPEHVRMLGAGGRRADRRFGNRASRGRGCNPPSGGRVTGNRRLRCRAARGTVVEQTTCLRSSSLISQRRVGEARKSRTDGALRESVATRGKRFQGFDSVRNPPLLCQFAPRTLQVPCNLPAGGHCGSSTISPPARVERAWKTRKSIS